MKETVREIDGYPVLFETTDKSTVKSVQPGGVVRGHGSLGERRRISAEDRGGG